MPVFLMSQRNAFAGSSAILHSLFPVSICPDVVSEILHIMWNQSKLLVEAVIHPACLLLYLQAQLCSVIPMLAHCKF